MAEYLPSYFNIAMHDVMRVEIGKPFTHVFEILPALLFGHGSRFYFLVESAIFGIFQHHIGDLSFSVDMNIDEFDNFGMR